MFWRIVRIQSWTSSVQILMDNPGSPKVTGPSGYGSGTLFHAMSHSAESAFVLWPTAHNLLKHYGPQCSIWLNMATALILFQHYGPELGTSFESDTNRISWISTGYGMYPNALAVYPLAYGRVSVILWPCFHLVMYTCACGCVSTCIIWLCNLVYSAQYGYALWAIVQNLVKR